MLAPALTSESSEIRRYEKHGDMFWEDGNKGKILKSRVLENSIYLIVLRFKWCRNNKKKALGYVNLFFILSKGCANFCTFHCILCPHILWNTIRFFVCQFRWRSRVQTVYDWQALLLENMAADVKNQLLPKKTLQIKNNGGWRGGAHNYGRIKCSERHALKKK